jgi:hypothetical protein
MAIIFDYVHVDTVNIVTSLNPSSRQGTLFESKKALSVYMRGNTSQRSMLLLEVEANFMRGVDYLVRPVCSAFTGVCPDSHHYNQTSFVSAALDGGVRQTASDGWAGGRVSEEQLSVRETPSVDLL